MSKVLVIESPDRKISFSHLPGKTFMVTEEIEGDKQEVFVSDEEMESFILLNYGIQLSKK